MSARSPRGAARTLLLLAGAAAASGCYLAHEPGGSVASGRDGGPPIDAGPTPCFPDELVLEARDEVGCHSIEAINPTSVTCPNRAGTRVEPARVIRLHRADPANPTRFFSAGVRGEGECAGRETCQGWLTEDSDPETCVCEYGFTGATVAVGGSISQLSPTWNERGTDAYYFQGRPNVIIRFWACRDAEPEL